MDRFCYILFSCVIFISLELVGCDTVPKLLDREPVWHQYPTIYHNVWSLKSRSQICAIYGHKPDQSKYPKCLRCKRYISATIVKPIPIFTTKEQMIIDAFNREGFSNSTCEKWLVNYGKSDLDGFFEYLKKGPLFPCSGGRGLDDFFNEVRKSYKVLERQSAHELLKRYNKPQ